jgi:hypothetical protein
VFSRGKPDPDDDDDGQCIAAFPLACGGGHCCLANEICNTLDPSVCCSVESPVSCYGTCCRVGYVCGPNNTCLPDGGGTDCSCRCDDGTACTTHADCGVDS